ncbi:MAG: hypothetical protein WBR24_00215 [Desulfobacterales bacterium]
MSLFVTMSLLNGLTLAALLFITASGLTLSFSLMHVVNQTHGALYMAGGFIGMSVAPYNCRTLVYKNVPRAFFSLDIKYHVVVFGIKRYDFTEASVRSNLSSSINIQFALI